MKTNTRILIALSATIAISLSVLTPNAAALPETTTYGTAPSPVGCQVVIMVASSTPTVPDKYNGLLVAILPAWIIIKNGTDETWIPAEKVLSMKVDRASQ